MAITPIRIPSLQQANPIVDSDGRMTTEFARRLNDILQNLGNAVNGVIDAQNAAAVAAAAAALAQTAADTAQIAADNAQTAADNAGDVAASNAREVALQTSTINPISVLTADPTTITIAAHTRLYGDGTSVAVSGSTIGATASGDTDYIYYDDPTRAGGAVTYVVTTTQPIQSGDRHVVGAVIIPATGTVDGGAGPRAPGYVDGNPIP